MLEIKEIINICMKIRQQFQISRQRVKLSNELVNINTMKILGMKMHVKKWSYEFGNISNLKILYKEYWHQFKTPCRFCV